ncbi:RodZ domain-containing protein [Vibrio rarus]|uniref:RodZ domain-containing protein n=1 Tax=Vibrio rarus TaxID=413403 RepID=UPI0021C2E381|nr:RodZ domain-containing protein [Vibrio rarus]
MNKESNNSDVQQTEAYAESGNTTPKVGDILKAKRESLGISQKEIADRLRLRLAIVQSIDSNDFQVGLVHTFTRGYIRSYARAVGADEKQLVQLFDDSELAQPAEHNMQSFSQKTKKTKHDNNIMKLTWGIFAIIVGISAVWWWQSEQNTDTVVSDPMVTTQSTEAGAPQQAVSDPSLLVKPESANPESSNPETHPQDSTAPDSTTPATKDGETGVATDNTAEKAASAPVIAAPKIAMSFKADCWIQVQDVHGKMLWTGVKHNGQQLELEGQGPFKFVLGAPEAVSLSISGEPIDLSRYTSGKVARFTAE